MHRGKVGAGGWSFKVGEGTLRAKQDSGCDVEKTRGRIWCHCAGLTPSFWGKGKLTFCNVKTLLKPVFLSWPLPASALVSSGQDGSSLWQVLQDVCQCPWPPRVTCQ